MKRALGWVCAALVAAAPPVLPARPLPAPARVADPTRVHVAALLGAEPAAAIDAAAGALLAATPVPGCSVAVVIDRQVAYARGYGLADAEQQVPATARTSYAWASISKTVTATAVMQLVEQERLDLERDVRTWVPQWPAKPEGPITLHHLLTHQSGIPHYGPDRLRYDDPHHYASCTEALGKFCDAPLRFVPGTATAYSTFAFTLVGCAVERAAGERFIDYVAAHIFHVAGMTTARADTPTALIPDRARGYRVDAAGACVNAPLHDPSYKIPGGGIRGSVLDLARFLAAVMQGRLVRPATLARMTTPQPLADGTRTTRGLGWQVARSLGGHPLGTALVHHGGAQTGVSTWCGWLPAEDVGVAVCANGERQGRPVADLAAAVLAIVRAPK